MTSKPNLLLQTTDLPPTESNQTGDVVPKKANLYTHRSHIPFSYPTNLGQRNLIRKGKHLNENLTLNQDLFLHNHGRSICSPVETHGLDWLDRVDAKTLILIEDFVRFIEECEYEAWYMDTDVNNKKIILPTLLGEVCRQYLPQLDNIKFSDLLNEDVLYSDRFYALASACEQIQFEGLNCYNGHYENPLSLRSHWQVHNALIRYTRFNLRC